MIKQLKLSDPNYPRLLKEICKPPEILNYKGNIGTLDSTCISIVGTRKYSNYGEWITREIVKTLSVLDVAIVSGMATGIDTIAHDEALKQGLSTIAILGSGIENIYPRHNIPLSKKIIESGLLLSEYDHMEEPKKFNFPQRNRIVSGLSVATIIIEAPERSGALITALLALEQNREILCVPGDIDRENSKGVIRLLQRGGAYPICTPNDILGILKLQPHLFPKPGITDTNPTSINLKLDEQESEIFTLLRRGRSTSLDEISKKSHLETHNILFTLSMLEIKGLISTKDGKYLRKC